MANNITINSNDSAETIAEKIETLDSITKDAIYRRLWLPHVIEDITSHLETRGELEDFDENDIIVMAKQYVYDGDYDCELGYWDNIDNLIDNYNR
ncbi:hypothetical protein J6A31_09200 [bacterium]|nr:hypothetical protein [bacterium]